MSIPGKADTSVPDTQETCYEGTNENFKIANETQNSSLNESQDFRLVDSEGDESMVERMKQTQDEDANSQKSIEQTDSEKIPEAQRMEESDVTANEKEDGAVIDEKVKESESVEKSEGHIFDELCGSERKDELFDEDEVVQGTPPRNYSPSRKVSSVDVMSLKRKASIVDEPPAKIPRVMSAEDATDIEKRLEEESRQSCGSDDSYQDLFKNINKNVIIEETQDPANLEFSQNTVKISTEHVTKMTNDETREHRIEHTDQQKDETFSKKCDVKEDENLNVSAKLSDTSANDSIIVNLNSTNENDSRMEDDSLSVGKGNVTSTCVVLPDVKSGIGTLDETESVKDTEAVFDENNQAEQSNCMKLVTKIVDNDEILSSQVKLRTSVELIFENRTVSDSDSRSKPQIVQIDDDGEKILNSSTEVIYDRQSMKTKPEIVQIDDSHEDGEKILDLEKSSEIQLMDKSSSGNKSNTDFSYKESMKESSLDSKSTDKRLVNGSTESKKSDTDATLSLDSDTFSISEEQLLSTATITATHNMKKIDSKVNPFTSKDMDNIEFINISDNETSNVEEKNKSDLIYNSTLTKTMQVEREIGVYVKFKCLLHVDESTKEPVNKELTAVQCEPVIIESVANKQKNEDSQSSLADISDNKDSSPGSVNSNPQLYQLNPSRLSIMSSISSLSSGSSASSLALKLRGNAHVFSMPVGPAKHAKKSQDLLLTVADKQTLDEAYDRLTREWKNHRLLTTTILNYASTELSSTTTAGTAATIVDTFANVSNERLDDHHHHLEKNDIRSSTPSDYLGTGLQLTVTPKSTKKGKAMKRPRNKLARSSVTQINGENGIDNIPNESVLHMSVTETDTPSNRKKNKIEDMEDKISDTDVLANSSLRSVLADEMIGKNVFAKWSDNNYYLGTVSDRIKAKYKVNFYDGKNKTLIPEFVIPIPKILKKGLSVYATTKSDDYGSCGIIVDIQTSSNDDTYYTVETDDGERLRVQIHNISLSTDQAQVLKEEVDSTGKSSLPNTPKVLGQVTLDNMVDGKRRSKRIGTPLFSTPKSKSSAGSISASKSRSEPSVSGISDKLKKEKAALSENEGTSSDSNIDSTRNQDEHVLLGVQREIEGMPYEHMLVKGPQSRIKSKSRSKKKVEDPQMIATLGPTPTNSNIFKDMSFILTCASLETLDRYMDTRILTASNMETEAIETDFETENEEDWVDRPFVRDRLNKQIVAGGGKVYDKFEKIPKDEYKNTMLITNVPNTTETSILCLSVGIPVCSHKWIIRCCEEGKIVNKAEHALPNGWSLQKKAYIETFETAGNKPLSKVIVIIPHLVSFRKFVTFWQQVCENAGAVVLIVENSEVMETMDFDSNIVVIVSNLRCPNWAVNRAVRLQIPVLSTTWVIQCIIEGRLCPQDQHPRYRYDYRY